MAVSLCFHFPISSTLDMLGANYSVVLCRFRQIASLQSLAGLCMSFRRSHPFLFPLFHALCSAQYPVSQSLSRGAAALRNIRLAPKTGFIYIQGFALCLFEHISAASPFFHFRGWCEKAKERERGRLRNKKKRQSPGHYPLHIGQWI